MPPRSLRAPALSAARYAPLLAAIKARVHSARIQAGLAANRELLLLYWDIGRMILARQSREGWGSRVIERLSRDLGREFPGQRGFSARNLKYMRALAEAWPARVVAPSAGPALLPAPANRRSPPVSPIVQAPLAQLPWYHHLALLDRLATPEDRLWYAAKAVEHGWSRNVLVAQIDARLHRRQGRAITNFASTLPPAQSDLAQGLMKDPYVFDFLELREDANERAVEDALLAHVEKFLLVLGVGFALVGRQVPLRIAGRDHSLDLLFYHLRLHCYLVVDLKSKEFTPEAAGKMNFYLSAVDEHFRQSTDERSIGLILVRSKERLIVEYALRDIGKPIGVSDYVIRLVDSLPRSLKGIVPSVSQLEAGLQPGLRRPTVSHRRPGSRSR